MKKIIFQREDANSFRPAKIKSFDKKKFLEMASRLKKAVDEEEKKYGPLNPNPQLS